MTFDKKPKKIWLHIVEAVDDTIAGRYNLMGIRHFKVGIFATNARKCFTHDFGLPFHESYMKSAMLKDIVSIGELYEDFF